MAESDTPRTPDPAASDAVNTPVGAAQGEDGSSGAPKGTGATPEHLAWKGSHEQLKGLMADFGVTSVEELQERLAQPPAAPQSPQATPTSEDDELDATLESEARAGNLTARALLRERREREALTGMLSDAFTLRDIKDPKDRATARALRERFPDRYGDYHAAYKAVQAAKLTKTVAEKEAENEALKAELATLRKPRDPDLINAPRTQGREVHAGERGQRETMTRAQFQSRVKALEGSGDYHAARAMRRRLNMGEISYSDA